MQEIWKDIEGYEELYQVSNLGRVKSLDRKIWNGKALFMKNGKILKPKTATNYNRVQLSGKDYYIHRLVAEAFIPNPNNLPQINHIDENTRNNKVDNLEWCTCKYNNNYGTKIERQAKKVRGVMINNKPIEQVDLNGKLIKKYNSALQAGKETNIDNSSICKVANGKLSKAGGFLWRWC